MDKSKVLCFSNQKGGVGKTLSVFNLGAALSKMNKSILYIDTDSQGSLTKSCGIENPKKTIYGVLLREYLASESVISLGKNLSIIGANKNLAGFEVSPNSPDIFFHLKDQLEELINSNVYDFILIDTAPSLGLTTVNAYVCSDEIYCPIEADSYSLMGLEEVINTIGKINKRFNPALKLAGIFATRYNARKLISRKVMEILNQDYPGLALNTNIRQCVELAEAAAASQHIYSYSPLSRAAFDYHQLSIEILNKYKK
jgi:chromosome partitioning protein